MQILRRCRETGQCLITRDKLSAMTVQCPQASGLTPRTSTDDQVSRLSLCFLNEFLSLSTLNLDSRRYLASASPFRQGAFAYSFYWRALSVKAAWYKAFALKLEARRLAPDQGEDEDFNSNLFFSLLSTYRGRWGKPPLTVSQYIGNLSALPSSHCLLPHCSYFRHYQCLPEMRKSWF